MLWNNSGSFSGGDNNNNNISSTELTKKQVENDHDGSTALRQYSG